MDAMKGCHCIACRIQFSKLELPLYMMNISAIHSLIVYDGVEAITFREPPLKRTLPGESNRCYGTIGRFEFRGGRAPVSATTGIVNGIIQSLGAHQSVEIGQVKERTRERHGDGIAGVQAEEVDTRDSVQGHVSAHV